MTAQIRPNRMEVNDRFPMLGFSIRVDQLNTEAEVVLATDLALFDPQNKAKRTAANFYSSREGGTLLVPRGDGVFVVAPSVLLRFVGSERLYFGLATGHSGSGGLQVDAWPREGSPYVSLRGFTGRSLRRSYAGAATAPRLEWAGDAARPGAEVAPSAVRRDAPAPAPATGGDNGNLPAGGSRPYDDGFGELPAIPARESAWRGAARPAPAGQVGFTMDSSTSAADALDWIQAQVEKVVAAVGSDVNPPGLLRLGDASSTFASAWETVFAVTSFIGPINRFFSALPDLARRSGVTLSVGPALDTPLFGAGLGVVFAPDGQVALFGAGDINLDFDALSDFVRKLKLALQAKLKLGYNRGGLDGFASLAKVASIAAGAEVVAGAEIWLDSGGNGLGGAVSIGVGYALELAAGSVAQADPRDRAQRIGGPFAGRVSEALDRGVDERVVQSLLDALEPSRRSGPMARSQAATRSINWDDVQLIPQPTDQTCWAAAAAMVIGWRDRVSLSPETLAQICSRSTLAGLSPYERETFAAEIGLETEPPQSYSADGFFDLLSQVGPLWVSKVATAETRQGHAVVVTGMYSDGGNDYVRIADPWDRVVGAPGAPGAYANTHGTGSRYIMRYEDFANEYELRIVGDPPTRQILHAGGTGGRVPNTATGAAPEGYAMAAPAAARGRVASAPKARVRQQAAVDPAPVGGTSVTVVGETSGDVAWQLPHWAGRKHPDDAAPAAEAPYQAAAVELSGWPAVGGTRAACTIRWYFNGTSVGPVHVERGEAATQPGWSLLVSGTIEDDRRLHPRSAAAVVPGPQAVPAVAVVLGWEFMSGGAGGGPLARSRVTLYADGTHEVDNDWARMGDGGDAPDHARSAQPAVAAG